MKKIQKLLFVLCLSGGIYTNLGAQDNEPQVIPESPNTASLGIYGQVPVGHYTGTPSISIPLYELNLDGKSFPLSISYHASGIKVAQEASWVGLGWALQAGGCISRQVNGLDDFDKNGFVNIDHHNEYMEYSKERDGRYYFYSYWEEFRDPEYYQYLKFFEKVFDSEPDNFFFNFAGYSFEAYFPREADKDISSDGFITPIIRNPKEHLEVKYHRADGRWVIRDTQGFTYYFASKETTQPESKKIPSCSIQTNYTANPVSEVPSLSHVSAWYLDTIEGPSGRTMEFTYQKDVIVTVAQRSEVGCAQNNKYPIREFLDPHIASPIIGWDDLRDHVTYFANAKVEQLRLDKIKCDEIEVSFLTSERKDLRKYGASLNDAKITPMNAALNKIQISCYAGNGSYYSRFKEYTFEHSYFGYDTDFRTCRLKLDAVYESYGNDKNKFYRFEYNNPILIPRKNSHAIDYWGYYTGRDNPTACWTIGSYSDSHLPNVVLNGKTIEGIDKNPNASKIQIGMLTSIQYPTGGKTMFEYEMHTFMNPSFSLRKGEGGGLRIKRIYDITDGKIYNERIYEYELGQLMNRVLSQCAMEVSVNTGGKGIGLHRLNMIYVPADELVYTSSSAIVPQSTDAAGSVVGYGRVKEIFIDAQSDEDGMTVYNFRNMRSRLSEDMTHDQELEEIAYWFYIPGFPTVPYLDNGLPTSTEYYDKQERLYRKVEYDYEKIASDNDLVRGFQTYLPNFMRDAVFVRYYPLRSEWWRTKSVKTTEYTNNISATQTEEYSYENRFKQLQSKKVTLSNGDIYTTSYTYPFDFENSTGTVYSKMTERSLLNYPVEVISYKNNQIVNSKLTTYKLVHNQYLPEKIFNLELENPVNSMTQFNGVTKSSYYEPIASVSFNRYNEKGNILEYETRDNILHSFIWGYDGNHPIAKLDNVAYSDLESWIGTSRLNSLYKSYTPSIDLETTLKSYATRPFMVNQYTYKPFVGFETVKDSRGIQTSYSYDVFGRLIETRDHNNHILNSIRYHVYHEK